MRETQRRLSIVVPFLWYLSLLLHGGGGTGSSCAFATTSSSFTHEHHHKKKRGGGCFLVGIQPPFSNNNKASAAGGRTWRRRRSSSSALSSEGEEEGEENNDNNDNDGLVSSSSSSSPPRGGAFAKSNTLPNEVPKLPTLKNFRQFALPCLGLWVASPLLSLVDTAFVGLSGSSQNSAQQLAALGPATTFFDGSCYLFAFLNVATTNLFSSAKASYGLEDERTKSVVKTACRLSIYCGIGIMLFLFATSRTLLRLYIGDKAANAPGSLDAASDYLSIRALSMPTTLLSGALQSALLGAQDSVTPLIAILYSTIVNVIGDYALVNRLKWGLQGAAIATTAAQWTATLALIGPARRKLLDGGGNNDKNKNPSFDIWIRKDKVDGGVTGRAFIAFAAPVLTLIVGKLAAFGFMTHSAAAVPGQPTPLASHQILLSLLFFCSPFFEVISQTAQTFLPPFYAPVSEHATRQKELDANYDIKQDATAQKWLNAAQTVATELLGIGLASAGIVASVASLVPYKFGNFITSDTVVQKAIKPLAKYLWMGAFFWAPVAVSEGVLLARRDLKFLAIIYMLSVALLPPALLQVKFRGGNVAQVWGCFCVFQLFRALCFTGKIWGRPLMEKVIAQLKKKRTTKAAATTSTESAALSQPQQSPPSSDNKNSNNSPPEGTPSTQ